MQKCKNRESRRRDRKQKENTWTLQQLGNAENSRDVSLWRCKGRSAACVNTHFPPKKSSSRQHWVFGIQKWAFLNHYLPWRVLLIYTYINKTSHSSRDRSLWISGPHQLHKLLLLSLWPRKILLSAMQVLISISYLVFGEK